MTGSRSFCGTLCPSDIKTCPSVPAEFAESPGVHTSKQLIIDFLCQCSPQSGHFNSSCKKFRTRSSSINYFTFNCEYTLQPPPAMLSYFLSNGKEHMYTSTISCLYSMFEYTSESMKQMEVIISQPWLVLVCPHVLALKTDCFNLNTRLSILTRSSQQIFKADRQFVGSFVSFPLIYQTMWETHPVGMQIFWISLWLRDRLWESNLVWKKAEMLSTVLKAYRTQEHLLNSCNICVRKLVKCFDIYTD